MKLHPDQMGHTVRFKKSRPPRLGPTPMELRIIRFAAEGHTNEGIALRSHYCLKTVKNIMCGLNTLCGTTNRTAMVLEAMRRGYVPCPHGHLTGHPPPRKPRPRRRNHDMGRRTGRSLISLY